MTHICISKFPIIGSDNGLLPGRRQAIIWTNAGLSLIGPLGTNFSETLIEIYTFSFKKMHLKMSSAKWWHICLSLNVFSNHPNDSLQNEEFMFCLPEISLPHSALILGLRSANEIRHYKVTPSLIGWVHPWHWTMIHCSSKKMIMHTKW